MTYLSPDERDLFEDWLSHQSSRVRSGSYEFRVSQWRAAVAQAEADRAQAEADEAAAEEAARPELTAEGVLEAVTQTTSELSTAQALTSIRVNQVARDLTDAQARDQASLQAQLDAKLGEGQANIEARQAALEAAVLGFEVVKRELVHNERGLLVGSIEHRANGQTRQVEVVYSDTGRPETTKAGPWE
jgi:hypothetical protein